MYTFVQKRGKTLSEEAQEKVTQILLDWNGGDSDAPERLMPLVYDELRRLARYYLSRERSDHTLQATALVNEAYLRLVDATSIGWNDRAHFYGVAAQMMRRILVDHARSKTADKRGGGVIKLNLEEAEATPEQRASDLVALDDALTELAKIDPRKSKIVELRFFGGLTDEEIAHFLGISVRTVLRDWKMAKMWLYRELNKG